MVTEEVGTRSPPFEHLTGQLVQLGGGNAGAARGRRHLEHLGHHPAGLAHLCDLVGPSPHVPRLPVNFPWSPACPAAERVGYRSALRSRAASTAFTALSVTSSGRPLASTMANSPRCAYQSTNGAVSDS